MNDLTSFWLPLLIVIGVIYLFVKSLFYSTPKKYKGVITKNKAEAKYYYVGRSKERDFTPEQRKQIYARDKGECQKCKAKGRRDVKTKNAPKGFKQGIIYGLSHIPGLGFLWLNLLCEIDHIALNSWNGDNSIENGRVLHRVCNRKRPWQYPDKDFLEFCHKRGEKIYIEKKRR